MMKKFLAMILAVAMLTAMWIIPSSADADLVLDLNYGNWAWKGTSETPVGELPLVSDYSANLTFELYIQINDFSTPAVIAGAWGEVAMDMLYGATPER